MCIGPDLEPMLAGAGVPTTVEGWVAEPKLEGWRARVLVDPELPDGVAVRTRRGRTIAPPIPGVADLAWSWPKGRRSRSTACSLRDQVRKFTTEVVTESGA